MPDQQSADLTLPSVVASLPGGGQEQALVLTIVFHPETNRIGETARFDKLVGHDSRILGRASPCFSTLAGSSAEKALDDPYISRAALHVRYRNGDVILSRSSTSSRARIAGSELTDETRLSYAQLKAGVPIQMGGRVVLLLRRAAYIVPSSNSRLSGRAIQGSSSYMYRLREQICLLASTDLDVLIRGETGTGKELVAEAIHAASARAVKKMIAVNMAAIPVALAPAALFGSARGAFTGADKAAAGYFEQAEGGTLFLDEIGDTPSEVQAQLLRALQQREIQCVGGPVRKVDLRVISATDAPLDDQACNFKAALRHRLSEAEIVLLPLRLHPEDTGELLWSFIKSNMVSMGRRHVLPGENSDAKNIALWAELFHSFICYSWPGNVRELNNLAQQVALASESQLVIPESVQACTSEMRASDTVAEDAGPLLSGDYSDEEFLQSFANAHYEVARVSRQLGISRQAVYRRISDSPQLCLASELSNDKIQQALVKCGGDIAAAGMQLKVSRMGLRERIRNTRSASAD